MRAIEKDNGFYCDCGFSWQRGMNGSHRCEDGLRVKLTDMAVQLANAESKCRELAAENSYLLNGASRELNTSWMFHKTMLGAQAALVCLTHGYQAAAREWLEGTTDEAGAEIPDDISVGELHEWFESNMVSNGGNSGFLTRKEAELAIRKECPATDAFLAEVRASAIPEGYVLVPQQIFLEPSDIESICSQCGDGHESGYGDFTDGLLWVGNIQRDDGSIVHGLHISSADYSEEGGVTVCEFAAQLRKGAAHE